ncbi:MAG: hypothetical protein QM802_03190 [Agriterribacter sp.]
MGSEQKSLPYAALSKDFVQCSVKAIPDTLPPAKEEPRKEQKDEVPTLTNPTQKAPDEKVLKTDDISQIKEVPKSRKKVKPVKIEGSPAPTTIIKPKIVIKKIKI